MKCESVSPRFIQTVEIGSEVLATEFTRAEWEKFIAEVRAGKHDWPGSKSQPPYRPVTLQVTGPCAVHSRTLLPGDTLHIEGLVIKLVG